MCIPIAIIVTLGVGVVAVYVVIAAGVTACYYMYKKYNQITKLRDSLHKTYYNKF